MLNNRKSAGIREVVGIFSRWEELQSAIDELLGSGFHRAELSLLASEHAVVKKLGGQFERTSELADNSHVPRTTYVSTAVIGGAKGAMIGALMYVSAMAAAGAILASGGTIEVGFSAMALAGGAGGLIGVILALWISDNHAHYLQEQIDRGGLLLWVRTRDSEKERRAIHVLTRHSGRDVHPHTIPVVV
jgi:hypothetical protein